MGPRSRLISNIVLEVMGRENTRGLKARLCMLGETSAATALENLACGARNAFLGEDCAAETNGMSELISKTRRVSDGEKFLSGIENFPFETEFKTTPIVLPSPGLSSLLSEYPTEFRVEQLVANQEQQNLSASYG